MQSQTLNISTSPHLVKGTSTTDIMRNVVYALVPTTGFAIYEFGLNALFVIITAIGSAVFTEYFLSKISNKSTTINDWSAVITGLLYGLTLPPTLPLWMVFAGGFISIALGKYAFGGLGYNVFNPALVGRAFLQAAFPVAMTTWVPSMAADRFSTIASSVLALPFMQPAIDGVTGATALSTYKFDKISADTFDLAFGFVNGSAGETGAVLILLGGAYLVYRNMMNWQIPVSILGTVFLFTFILHTINPDIFPTPQFMLFAGGLMLGAVFMATDMVSSPITSKGMIVYGTLIGLVVVVIRLWGGLPEGVMYAILLANALSPHIDKLFKNRVYGTGK